MAYLPASWFPLDPHIQSRFNPCGMVMDLLNPSQCYWIKMRLFVDSDREDWVRWYITDCDALYFPVWHLYASHVWMYDKKLTWKGVGELQNSPKIYNDGTNNQQYKGQCFIGQQEWFQYGPSIAILSQPAQPIPSCCQDPTYPANLFWNYIGYEYRTPDEKSVVVAGWATDFINDTEANYTKRLSWNYEIIYASYFTAYYDDTICWCLSTYQREKSYVYYNSAACLCYNSDHYSKLDAVAYFYSYVCNCVYTHKPYPSWKMSYPCLCLDVVFEYNGIVDKKPLICVCLDSLHHHKTTSNYHRYTCLCVNSNYIASVASVYFSDVCNCVHTYDYYTAEGYYDSYVCWCLDAYHDYYTYSYYESDVCVCLNSIYYSPAEGDYNMNGSLLLNSGYHEIGINTGFYPEGVVIYLVPRGVQTCGQANTDTASWTPTSNGFNITADIHSNYAELFWWAWGDSQPSEESSEEG